MASRNEHRKDIERLPLFEGPTDRELFRLLVHLGILNAADEHRDWREDVKRGEDGVKIRNFNEFIASNRDRYLRLLSLHHEGLSPGEIRQRSDARARENIRRLSEHIRATKSGPTVP